MVKLFVGNLADGVDSHRLKNLFLQYVHVQECDVLKNFAFVHVVTEEDAETAIARLDKHRLEGREIHIERSTSRLRKEPGMGDKCFTCGAFDHKTPYCPLEAAKRKDVGDLTAPMTSTIVVGQKRNDDSEANGSPAKKARFMSTYLGDNASAASKFAPALAASCKVGGGDETDPELPCPQNPELRTLYDQYIESRTRYFFYRERLGREINALIESGTFLAAGGATAADAAPIHLGTIDLTKRSAGASASVPTSASAPAQVSATVVQPASIHLAVNAVQPSYVTTYTTGTSQPQPQVQPQIPAVSYGNLPPTSQLPIPGQHIYVVPANPQLQPVSYQPPVQIVQQAPSTVVYPQHQPPTVVPQVQPPPAVYAPPPLNPLIINEKLAPQHYSTYNATPPTSGAATITRIDLTQPSSHGHSHGGSGPNSQEPQFRIKINAPGVGTPPPRLNNNFNNNSRQNNNSSNNNWPVVDNNPLLANLAAATVAALRAAPQLAAAAAASRGSGGPPPLAHVPRPLLRPPSGGPGHPPRGGGPTGRFPPLMGRRN